MAPPLRPFVALLGSYVLGACGYGDGGSHAGHHYQGNETVDDAAYYDTCGAPERAAIDAGRLLEATAGVGAGVFIEYEAGGTYRITTTCDAAAYGDDCPWDIVVTPLGGAAVESMSPIELEETDTLLFGDEQSIRLLARTGADFDGFSFKTEPGASIRFDALLDDTCANRYMFWVGDGALHAGAPSNVLELSPSEL